MKTELSEHKSSSISARYDKNGWARYTNCGNTVLALGSHKSVPTITLDPGEHVDLNLPEPPQVWELTS